MDNAPDQKSSPSRGDNVRPYLKYSGIAFQMIGAMVLAAWGGRKLDAHFQTQNPWFTIVLLVLAVIGSMVLVILSLNKK